MGAQDYDKQGRDDRLANTIIDRLDAIRSRSQGSFDELTVLLTTARYPHAGYKIRKLSWPQLQGMWTLISGFESQLNADGGAIVNTSIRPVLSIGTVHQPFTIKRADGVAQQCFLAAVAPIAYTFLPANKTGAPSSNVSLAAIFTTNLGAGAMPMASKRSDTEILVRNHNLQAAADRKIRRVTLSSAGVIQTAYLQDAAGLDISLANGAAGFTDRPYIEDFCDGVNLWAMEYNDTTNVLRLHKVALATGVETILVINNVKLGVTGGAYFEGAFFAQGDNGVLLVQSFTGNESMVVFFNLPDGNATTTIDANVGAAPQTDVSAGGDVIQYYTVPLIDTAQLRGFHLSLMVPGTRTVRAFLTPNLAGSSTNPINVVDIDPVVIQSSTPVVADATGNVTVEKILGQTDGGAIWPLPRTSLAVSNSNMHRAAASANGERLLAVNGAASPWDLLLFSATAKRQLSTLFPVSSRVTTIDRLSRMNAKGANMLAVVASLSDVALVELSA